MFIVMTLLKDGLHIVFLISLVVDHFGFELVVDNHLDLDSTEDGEFHCLFKETLLPLAECYLLYLISYCSQLEYLNKRS